MESRKIKESEKRSFNQIEFLEWLSDFNLEYNPDMPSFEIIQAYLNNRNKTESGEICITGFVDFEIGTLIDLENACNTYHVLPYSGGLLDQPLLLLEAFSLVRSEINRYEKVRADKIMAKHQNSGEKHQK